MTGSSIVYSDLISQEDRDYWQYLCKKDIRRLEKLVNKSMGEGHFIGDSGEDESDEGENQHKNTPADQVEEKVGNDEPEYEEFNGFQMQNLANI